MDLGTLIKILIKRWYVVLPVVVLTMATAFQVGRSMRPDYQARGAVLLVGPNIAGGDDVNPLAELRSPLNTTALAISLIAVDEQTRTEIRALGFQGTYSVDVTPSTPIVNVRVRAETPQQALLTLEAVIEAVELKLDERQRGVDAPENSLIQTEVLTRTTTARAVFGSRDRAVTVVAGLGLVAAASAAIIVNSWAIRREQTFVEALPSRRRRRLDEIDDENDENDENDDTVVAGVSSDDRSAQLSSALRRRLTFWRRERADALAAPTPGGDTDSMVDVLADAETTSDAGTREPDLAQFGENASLVRQNGHTNGHTNGKDPAVASLAMRPPITADNPVMGDELVGDRTGGVGQDARGSSDVESSDER